MLGAGRSSDEGMGGIVPEHVPTQLFSDTSGTITDVPLHDHSLLWKDQKRLVQMTLKKGQIIHRCTCMCE